MNRFSMPFLLQKSCTSKETRKINDYFLNRLYLKTHFFSLFMKDYFFLTFFSGSREVQQFNVFLQRQNLTLKT